MSFKFLSEVTLGRLLYLGNKITTMKWTLYDTYCVNLSPGDLNFDTCLPQPTSIYRNSESLLSWYFVCVCIYIYIYIEREREREREDLHLSLTHSKF